jgi:alkylation response protein AidB-like acyl-CoA dehydrogenase
MNATEFSVDRRDIRFVQKEFLKVGQLATLPDYKHFSEADFDLIVDEGNTFAEKVIAPLNKTGDEQGARLVDGTVVTAKGFKEAWKQAAEGGWFGVTSPAEFGGQGLPLSVALGALESFYGGNPSWYLSPMLTTGAAGLIVAFGDERQKATYCEKMISGQWGGTMCLSEPGAGSAVGDITTRAVKAQDGDHYLIQGVKCWITGGDHDWTENIVHLVLARAEGAPPGPKGISLFIVPKYRVGKNSASGEPNDVTTVRLEHKLGIRASPTAVLEFGAKGNCHGTLLQGENLGMAQMFQLMNHARFTVAYQGLGSGAAAYRNALAYAREREQGVPIEHGKDPNAPRAGIVHHPDVRHMLMTMKALIEGMRGILYSLAFYTDLAKHGPAETRGIYQDLVDILTPIAKNHGADQGFEVCRLGIQVLGGVGFTEEFPIAQAMRDTKIASIYEGTSGIQALDLVTRKLRLRGGELFRALLKEVSGLRPEQAKADSLRQAVSEWQDGVEKLKTTVAALMNIGDELGPRHGVFNASDVTVFFGDVMGAYYLLKMAVVAEQQLGKLANGKDARAVAEENEEARFYFNKIKTAEHYVYQILPRGKAAVAKVQSRNFAALDAILEA